MPDRRRGHLVPLRFDFTEPRHTTVFVCARVLAGAPVLHVVHDAEDGSWQFLCGGSGHGEGGADGASLGCLECTVARDLSLNELADLPDGYSAHRDRPGAPWRRHDDHEDFILAAVRDPGWAVQLIPAGDATEPAFAYSVGLHRSFGHPELITFGLGVDVMAAMLNTCGERVRDGEALPIEKPFDGIVDGYPVILRPVRARASFTQHVGYAGWFYRGWEFPLLQLLWPDRDGRFPGERGAAAGVAQLQPLLP